MLIGYDFHIHSCLSPCAEDDMTPANIAGMARVNGLDAIALTDHNTCRNCAAFLHAAKHYGIFAVCGMELTTAEEVHVLCYFPDLIHAMAFDNLVRSRQMALPNQPDLFGNQLLYGNNDQCAGTFEPLLITATDISFSELPSLITAYDGFYIPAHVEKKSDSLLSNLGFVPEGSTFHSYEINHPGQQRHIETMHPYFQSCIPVSDSDAHRLTEIKDSANPCRLEVSDLSFEGIREALCPSS